MRIKAVEDKEVKKEEEVSTDTDILMRLVNYANLIKDYHAREISDPNTILLALFQKFINDADAQAKTPLFAQNYQHVSFCRSCFVEEKKSDEKLGATAESKQQFEPKYHDINSTITALNNYFKEKSMDINSEFAMMLITFFSVYSNYTLGENLQSKLSLLDPLEILIDIPKIESHLRRSEAELKKSDSFSQSINLLFQLMSTQQKDTWVESQLKDLNDKNDNIRSLACSALYENREHIPSDCWPKIIACLTDCLADVNFREGRTNACKLISEHPQQITPELWPKVIENFLFTINQPSFGDHPEVYSLFKASTYVPQEFWPSIIRQIYDKPNDEVFIILSAQLKHVPKELMPTVLNSLIKRLINSTPDKFANTIQISTALNDSPSLLSKEQWENEIIPFLLQGLASKDTISIDRFSLNYHYFMFIFVPHIPKDSSLWPQIIESIFGMKDAKDDKVLKQHLEDLEKDDTDRHCYHSYIPEIYWNGIITTLLSHLEKNPTINPMQIFSLCSDYTPASLWPIVFSILKKHCIIEKQESKENIKVIPWSTLKPIFGLCRGLKAMPDALKPEVIQWLMEQLKLLNWYNSRYIYEAFRRIIDHIPKNAIPEIIYSLLPHFNSDDLKYKAFDSIVKAFDPKELTTEFSSNLLTLLFRLIEDDDNSPGYCENFHAAVVHSAPLLREEHWPEVIKTLTTHLQSKNLASKARSTLIKVLTYVPANIMLDPFKQIISSLQSEGWDKNEKFFTKMTDFIAALPDASRTEIIHMLLLELAQEKTRRLILLILINSRGTIPPEYLLNVLEAILKYGDDTEILSFLSPPINEREPLKNHTLVIDALSKIQQRDDKEEENANLNQINASIQLVHYSDTISVSLWPKIIKSLITGLNHENKEIRINSAHALVQCLVHISDQEWSLINEKLIEILKSYERDAFIIFLELVPHIPVAHWKDFINSFCIEPTFLNYGMFRTTDELSGEVLGLCISHVPQKMRFEICKDLLNKIDNEGFCSDHPFITAFLKLMTMLEHHECIFIISSLTNRVTQSSILTTYDQNILKLLTKIHEAFEPRKRLQKIFPDNVEKCFLEYVV